MEVRKPAFGLSRERASQGKALSSGAEVLPLGNGVHGVRVARAGLASERVGGERGQRGLHRTS